MRFQVSGMTCDHCVQTVTAKLKAVDGVDDGTVNLAEGTARVVLDEAKCDPQKIVDAIRGAGFQVTGFAQAD